MTRVNNLPEVSIITPCHNSDKYIGRAVQSVISQTYEKWELILVDDGSTGGPSRILKQHSESDPRIRLMALDENSGAAMARNTARHAARGRYIAFLDSDDYWLPHKLQKQLDFTRKKQAAFVFSAYCKQNVNSEPLGVIGVPKTVTYHDLLKTGYIGCLTAMYDARILGKVEMPLIRMHEDLGLWLRLLQRIPVAHGQQEVLAVYTVRPDSISASKFKAAAYQWKLYRDMERLNLTACSYYFTQYAIRGVLRRFFPRLAYRLGVLHRVQDPGE